MSLMTVAGKSVLTADLQKKPASQATVYNGEADFWQNYNPKQVVLSAEANLSAGKPSDTVLKIEVSPARDFFSLLGGKLNAQENWSEDKALILDFKGAGSGIRFNMEVFSGGSQDDGVLYSFVDDSRDWKQLFFVKDKPTRTAGKVNWENVSGIRLSADEKNMSGTFYLGNLTRAGYEEQQTLEEVGSSSFYLADGMPIIELNNTGELQLDQLAFYSVKARETGITFQDIFRAKEDDRPVVTYEKKSPTRYVAHVKTSVPFYLVFSDSYHDLWRVYAGKEEIKPIITDSFVNGFYLTQTGEYDVTIVFTGQRYLLFGGIISLLSLVATVTYPLYRRKLPRLRRRREELP